MIHTILKISLIGWAFITVSCALQEPIVQSQTSVNTNSNLVTTTNQNTSNQISSNANSSPTKNIDYYAHLKPKHREVLQEWLKSKTHLRPAAEEKDSTVYDEEWKSTFESNMKMLRDTVGENGHQFYSVGDMNGDGKEDFAVLVVDSRKENENDADRFGLAIFNAPFKVGQEPAYYEDNLYDIAACYIVFDKMGKKHLYLGKFESDVYCATYYPKGKTYHFKDCQDE
jgi:hypothetical protein